MGDPARPADVHRRGPGRRGGPPGPAVRRPQRQAARPADARGARHHPRPLLHRQRGEVPAARQPRPEARRDRRLPAVPRRSSSTSSGPAVVVTLGRFAAQWLLQTTEGITKLRGRSYPFAHGVLIPTLHPAAALRGGAEPLAQMRADFVRAKLALADGGRDRDGRRRSRCARRRSTATQAVGGGAGRAGARRRPAAAGRRPRRRQDRVRPGLRPRPSASTEPITSPTFTLVHEYAGRLPHAPPRRVPPRAPGRGGRPRPRRAARRRRRHAHRVGRRHRSPCCPPTTSRCASRFGDGDDDRAPRAAGPVGPRWAAAAAGAVGAGRGGLAMLILGIETATAAGRAAPSAATRACSAPSSRPAAAATPRRSTPAIEFLCRAGPTSRSPRSACVAVDLGPGLFTGLRVGRGHRPRRIAHALRVPMIGISSLDLLAFPLRHSPAGRSSPRSTPAAASSSTPSTARCPAACSASREPPGRHARRPRRPSCWPRGDEYLLVGDGALRYRDALREAPRRRARRAVAGPPVGRARSCSWPTPRRCARSA